MRDVDAIIEAVAPDLRVLERSWEELVAETRGKRREVLKAMVVLFVLGGGLGAAIESVPVIVVAGIVSVIVGALAYHAKVIAPVRELEAMIRGNAIAAIVGTMEPEMTHSPFEGIPERRFVDSGLFRSPDRYSHEDGLRGAIGETDVHISEVHAEQRHESRDSEGNVQTRYTTIFKGVFMVADFHKHFHGTTRVLPDTTESLFGSLGKMLQGFKPFSSEELVYLEDPDFEKQFVVYSTDQIEARYILSTSMARRILELRHRWDDDVRLSFVGSDVYVAISHGRDLFEPKLQRGTLSRDELTRMVSEVAVCFGLVDHLNLNTRIWSKG